MHMVSNSKGTVSSNLYEPHRKNKKHTHQIRHQQIVMDHTMPRGFSKQTVKRIKSHDMGKTHVGVCNGQIVKRVGMANGFLTKRGETAGRWEYAA